MLLEMENIPFYVRYPLWRGGGGDMHRWLMSLFLYIYIFSSNRTAFARYPTGIKGLSEHR